MTVEDPIITTTFTIPSSLKEKIDTLSKKENRSRSNLATIALLKYFNEYKEAEVEGKEERKRGANSPDRMVQVQVSE